MWYCTSIIRRHSYSVGRAIPEVSIVCKKWAQNWDVSAITFLLNEAFYWLQHTRILVFYTNLKVQSLPDPSHGCPDSRCATSLQTFWPAAGHSRRLCSQEHQCVPLAQVQQLLQGPCPAPVTPCVPSEAWSPAARSACRSLRHSSSWRPEASIYCVGQVLLSSSFLRINQILHKAPEYMDPLPFPPHCMHTLNDASHRISPLAQHFFPIRQQKLPHQ